MSKNSTKGGSRSSGGDKEARKECKERKEHRARRERFNFIPWLIVIAVIAVIFLIIFICYRAEGQAKIIKLGVTEDGYTDEKNGITYVSAPRCYTFVLKSSEPYASTATQQLYYIGSRDEESKKAVMQDPKRWLCTDNDHGGLVYYDPEKESVPSGRDFLWDKCYLCSTGGTVFATHEFDSGKTDALLSAYYGASESENLYEKNYGSFDLLKEIRVTSHRYTHLYLCLYLFGDNEGNYYIGSAYDRRLVKADSSFFAPIFVREQ